MNSADMCGCGRNDLHEASLALLEAAIADPHEINSAFHKFRRDNPTIGETVFALQHCIEVLGESLGYYEAKRSKPNSFPSFELHALDGRDDRVTPVAVLAGQLITSWLQEDDDGFHALIQANCHDLNWLLNSFLCAIQLCANAIRHGAKTVVLPPSSTSFPT